MFAQLFSRPSQEILAEVARLVRNGYRRSLYCGIHLGWYRR
jgi:tRNA A37 methylthiotransferase MiaB